MWSREYIKNYAKAFLKKHYWKAFLVCIIALLLNGSSVGNTKFQSSNHHYGKSVRARDRIVMEMRNPILNMSFRKLGIPFTYRISKGIALLLPLGFFILSITVGNIIEVGKVRFFLRGFEDDVQVGNVFSAFSSDEYSDVLKTQFLKGLYILLWALLFVIPGIIKAYEYRMVPYILSDDPNMPSNQVISMSRAMTRGHKWDMFILDLSFLGWYLLGAVFFGIGGIFVYPYEEATYAKLYNILSGYDEGQYNNIEYEIQ